MTGIKMGKKERKMEDITKKIYATCTSPTMHLICPPKILDKHALFTVSLGTAVIPRRNEKQRVMQNRGGQIRCIVGDVQVQVQQQSKNIEKN